MKTLNEVIKANECCDHGEPDSRCEDCPYNGIGACCAERESDALHYLKMFRDTINALNVERENCIEAACKYIEAEKELESQIVQTMQVDKHFEFEITDNQPLTWDELRTMEGKPVWIDSVPLIRRWVIIKKFHPIGGNKNLFDMEVEDGAHFLRKNMRRDDPAWWQAYRRERK